MTVPTTDVQSLAAGTLLELFELDSTALGGSLARFHAGKNALVADVVWNGNTYSAFPVQASGFEFAGGGTLPQPKIQVANVTGLIGALCRDLEDLVGAKLTRKRTFVKYLDAVNFPGGVNPTADPNAAFPDDVWFINRKSVETREVVEFELAAAFDVQGVKLPRRQIIANLCTWRYRGAECGYAGGAVATVNDIATSVLGDDACGKRLASCRLRFGAFAALPFGGFPGAGLVR
jgi:lambda family phage minor tail protein L